MNLFAIGAAGYSVFFKLAAAKDVYVIDYQMLRNISVLVYASV